MQMNLPDRYSQVDADRECSGTSEESSNDQQSSDQFCEGRHIAKPRRESHSPDHVGEVLQATKNFVIAVSSHNDAQREAHYQKCERLQAIEITQTDPPSGRDRLTQQFGPAEYPRRIVSKSEESPAETMAWTSGVVPPYRA